MTFIHCDANKNQFNFCENNKIELRAPISTAIVQRTEDAVQNKLPYYRLEVFTHSPQMLRLPDDLVQEVNEFLEVEDITRMARINKDGYIQTNQSLMKRAHQFEYRGENSDGAKKYLKSLVCGIKVFCELEDIPAKSCVFNFSGRLLPEATLRVMTTCPIIQKTGWTPVLLTTYCHQGLFDVVQTLLYLKSDPNQRHPGGTGEAGPLDGAAMSGNVKIVSLLLDHKADVTRSCGIHSALMPYVPALSEEATPGRNYYSPEMACQTKKIIQLFLQAGADVNKGLMSLHPTTRPLHMAANNHPEALEIMSLLINAKADVNALAAGATPLHFALKMGHDQGTPEDVVKKQIELLLDAGADPSINHEVDDNTVSTSTSKLAEDCGYQEIAAYINANFGQAAICR